MPKTKLKIGETVIKLIEERNLYGRFLSLMEYRPGIVPKLNVTIGEYEMSVVARSLCMNDGSLIIPTDKSTLMNTMASMNGPVSYELPDIRPQHVRRAIGRRKAISAWNLGF